MELSAGRLFRLMAGIMVQDVQPGMGDTQGEQPADAGAEGVPPVERGELVLVALIVVLAGRLLR